MICVVRLCRIVGGGGDVGRNVDVRDQGGHRGGDGISVMERDNVCSLVSSGGKSEESNVRMIQKGKNTEGRLIWRFCVCREGAAWLGRNEERVRK